MMESETEKREKPEASLNVAVICRTEEKHIQRFNSLRLSYMYIIPELE